MLTTAEVGLSMDLASFSTVRVGARMDVLEDQQGVTPPTALVKGQKPLGGVSKGVYGMEEGWENALGTAAAGNRIIVISAARQLGEVAVGGLREVVEELAGRVGGGTAGGDPLLGDGPRAALGAVAVATDEAGVVDGGAGVN
jgi:hypothetical protein